MDYYFSHDFKARYDKKLVNLQMKKGLEGIGAYWCIVEILNESNGSFPLKEYDRITFELRTNDELINYIIFESELFVNDGENFWSESILKRTKKRQEKSEKQRENVNKRWLNSSKSKENKHTYDGNTNVIPNEIKNNNYGNTNVMPIKVKVKDKVKIKDNLNIDNNKKDDPKIFFEVKKYFLDFYKNEFQTDYYFLAKDGKAINSIIKKIKFEIKQQNMIETDELVLKSFIHLISNIKIHSDFVYKNFMLSLIDSNFNILIKNMKNGNKENIGNNKEACSINELAELMRTKFDKKS